MYVCDIMQKMYKELVGMIKNLQIIRVNTNYCDYLRKFDPRVAYNMNEKEIRPFVGILFKIEDCEYFAPLSSPKPKHKKMKNTIDFLKIKNGELGAVNFNNMIPVKRERCCNFKLLEEKCLKYTIIDRSLHG